MRRLGIFLFYDRDGFVGPHVHQILNSFAPHLEETIFVVNGALDRESFSGLEEVVTHVLERENKGFDVWGYKAGIEHVGFDRLDEFDEIVLFNYTFFAPLLDLSIMFDAMATREVDGWGMTAYRDAQKTFLQSYFLVSRRSLHGSDEFRAYWETMPMISSINDSLDYHEFRFSRHFTDLGFRLMPYVENQGTWDGNTTLTDVPGLFAAGMPVVKYRAFNFDPDTIEARGGRRIPDNFRFIDEDTPYPVSQVWSYIVSQTTPDDLITAAELLRVVPDNRGVTVAAEGCPQIFVHLADAEDGSRALSQLDGFPAARVHVATDVESIAAAATARGYQVRPTGGTNVALLSYADLLASGSVAAVVQLSDFAGERDRYFFKEELYAAYWRPLLQAAAWTWLEEAPHLGMVFAMSQAVHGTTCFAKATVRSLPNWASGYQPAILLESVNQTYWPLRGNALIRGALAREPGFAESLRDLCEHHRPRAQDPLAGVEAALPALARKRMLASGLVIPQRDVAKLILRGGLRMKQTSGRVNTLVGRFRADVKALQEDASASQSRPGVASPSAVPILSSSLTMHSLVIERDGVAARFLMTMKPRFFVEDLVVTEARVRAAGWAFDAANPHQQLQIALFDGSRLLAPPRPMTVRRPDVLDAFPKVSVEETCGFDFETTLAASTGRLSIVVLNEADRTAAQINRGSLWREIRRLVGKS